MKIELPELRDGEHNAGLMLDEHGKPEYWLIEAPMPDDSMNWNKFKKWADKLGYRVASKRDGRLMAANKYAGLPTIGAFWLEECDSSSDFAYIQHFYNGTQDSDCKSRKYRARAVRRVPAKELE